MVIQRIAILLLLITQVLSAPSGCIESCGFYTKQFQTGSQIPGNIQGYNDLTQTATRLQGHDYSRPGTWSEHNDYNTDNGNGKVHEEHGQIVDGPKTVRYYKKNYSSSYSTGNAYGTVLPEIEHQNNYGHGIRVSNTGESFNSQQAYNQMGNIESSAQQREYNRIQSQQHTQSSVRRANTQSERLEDFGEYGGSSQGVQDASDLATQISQKTYSNAQPRNWSKVDSYGTDGGHGQVFEEEGQYVSGPKKVRYYKRNYTSSSGLTSSIPISEVTNTGVENINREIEKFHREIGKEFNQISSTRNTASSNIAQTNIGVHELASDNLYSNTHRSQIDHGSSLSTHHNKEQHLTDTVSKPYINPSQNTYGANSFSMYERHEGYVPKLQPSTQFINPTPGYTNVLNTENSGYNRNIYSKGIMQQQTDSMQETQLLDSHQSRFNRDQMTDDNLRQNIYSQNRHINSGMPGRVSHYKEHWSSSHTKETVPQYSPDISHTNEQSALYNNRYRENSFNSAHQTTLEKLRTGEFELSQMGNHADCTQGTTNHVHTDSQLHRKYKRSSNSDPFSYMQQSDAFDDLTQQTSGKPKIVQGSQHFHYWRPSMDSEQSEDLTQQTGEFDDLTQQTSGKLEFGLPSLDSYEPHIPYPGIQQTEDWTQQTGEFDDLTQQTSGKLEFGPPSRDSYQPRKPNTGNQQTEDWTQQTGEFDDLTQQTSGKLEFGPPSRDSYQPRKPNTGNQQTGEFDDLTQQTSGKLEFGPPSRDSYQPRKPNTGNQQTGEFDDLTQQTSGKLEFGPSSRDSYQPRKPNTGNQQTGEFDDLTQQTSGKLEFGPPSRDSYQPRKPNTGNQQTEDLTQQTGEFDDLTQQTSGKLEFGPPSRDSYQPRKPNTGNQQTEDWTQQTGEFDDLTQQTSGKLEFGPPSRDSYQPRKPNTGNQQTGEFDDLTQQTSGKLEFGPPSRDSYQPRKPNTGNQQTGEFDDLTQQTSGKLEFGPPSRDSYQPRKPNTGNQQTEDWTQQTGEFDDLTQQTSGKLEFGPPSRDSYQPRKPNTGNQQTGEFDDLTQQTSGKLEFGPPSRDSYQPRKPNTGNQQTEDLTQQTGEFDDLTQQTSGKLEFGSPSRDSYQPRKPNTGNQQIGEFDDLTQQTSGKLEFGPPSRDSYQPRKPNTGNQQTEDLTQQTGEFDDLTQQSSGKLEFGPPSRDSYQPRKPNTGNQQTEDLTQQTGEFDDLTQQTSGKLEFGPPSRDSYQPRKPNTGNQQTEDWTQQTGEFDDLTQQTSGKLEFGQQPMEHNPYFLNSDRSRESVNMQNSEVNTQRNENLPVVGVNGNIPVEQQVSSAQLPKPAGKPKPRSRYSRIGALSNIQNMYNSDNQQPAHPDANIYELPPNVVTETDVNKVRDNNIRGDQNANNFMDTDTSRHLNQLAADKTHSIDGAYVDSVNSLHKSNDATVGLQWHYTYHPSDQRQFIQQTDQRDKGDIQQQSSSLEFQQSDRSFDQQETQNIHQQSSIFDNEESEISQKYQDKSDNIKKQSELEFSQQRASEIDNDQHAQSSETKLQLEPRIIEVYGGGPYEASHNDDIYSGITVNPSATLPPINNGDPWDIHEKPREVIGIVNEVTSTPMSVKPLNENDETTHAPSFWSKIGSQITTTFGKAKEKAKTIFG